MANWKRTVDIEEVLRDDAIPDEEKCPLVAEVLRKAGGFPASIVDTLEKQCGDDYDEERANHTLHRLYDYADAHLIWLGL